MAKNGCWDIVTAVLPHMNRVLLSGPPGTGKTFAGTRAGLSAEQRVYSITLTEETPAAELRGHYIPVEGKFLWQDGPGIAAWRTGGRLVINEIDHASADVMSLLHVLLDSQDTAALTLPSGETVRPAPGFSVVATMNGEPAGLPMALRDRFPVSIVIDTLHPDAVASLPMDLQGPARDSALCEEERRTSIRVWQAFATLREKVKADVAAAACFGVRANDALAAVRLAKASV